jgi:diaminohydroxyphosphoribosylaminopyrimidine deaminase/5-amino-6-(5-phosphoribosylamino)uracil reductase
MISGFFMQRGLQLASLGAGVVAPNPMVGAVLVHEGKIIGEGWHKKYGEAHAEVNCIASVREENKHNISRSTLYVTLEPCAHFGKTPPCADLIIRHKIPRVVIGCRDPFAEVDGKGIEKLKAAGVEVIEHVLEKECKELNKRFFTFHSLRRSYIILKWSQTGDGKMAYPADNADERLFISNEYSNRLVHRWRSEEAAIMVGTNTALLDDPELSTRLWKGSSPVRLVLDKELRLPSSLKLFNQKVRTIVFNALKHEEQGNLLYYQLTGDESIVQQIVHALYQLNIQSVLVEGGAQLLQSFIDEGIWDEIRKIENRTLKIGNGLGVPVFTKGVKTEELEFGDDKIEIFSSRNV